MTRSSIVGSAPLARPFADVKYTCIPLLGKYFLGFARCNLGAGRETGWTARGCASSEHTHQSPRARVERPSAVVDVRSRYPGQVTTGRPGRTVYSTLTGRTCPRCGWPEKDCRCSSNLEQPVPERIVARLRMERAGRRGKTVTVVEGLPCNHAFLKSLAAELKRACGGGGTVREDRIEIQGDHRDRLRQLLKGKGWQVKG